MNLWTYIEGLVSTLGFAAGAVVLAWIGEWTAAGIILIATACLLYTAEQWRREML